jgi:hypothetical protein
MIKIRHIVGAVLLFINGLKKIIRGSRDFYELEERVHELSQRVCSQILVWALEQIDTRLMNERDRQEWKVVGFRGKDAISTFGEFTYRRRLYKNKKTGETKYFLDELLGWPVRERITPRLKEIAIKLSTEMSFRRAAETLSQLLPGISPMTVWKAVHDLGEDIKQQSEEKRLAVFRDGEAPRGDKSTTTLCIEGDGVIIRLQKAKQKRGEIKHLVAYEGKEEISRKRYALKNKLVVSGLADGETMWEETYAKTGEEWDLNRVEKVYIGGDGADWPKQGLEYFPGAEYRLDPYHLSKHLTEALWHDEETFNKVREAIYQGDLQKTRGILEEAIKRTKGNRKKRLIKLLSYLTQNWEGITTSPGVERLGAIEGQIQHNIARRMKRLGARWTIPGGDRMTRILAEKANGELEHHTLRWPVNHQKLKEISQTKLERESKIEDLEKWLRTSLPALKGPFAGRSWIKYVLKELTRPNLAAII